MVFEHTSHVQIFNRYQCVVFAEIAGELMAGIFADVGNTSVCLCYGLPRLCAVLAAFLASGLLPL